MTNKQYELDQNCSGLNWCILRAYDLTIFLNSSSSVLNNSFTFYRRFAVYRHIILNNDHSHFGTYLFVSDRDNYDNAEFSSNLNGPDLEIAPIVDSKYCLQRHFWHSDSLKYIVNLITRWWFAGRFFHYIDMVIHYFFARGITWLWWLKLNTVFSSSSTI